MHYLPDCDLTLNDSAVRRRAADDAVELFPCLRRQHLSRFRRVRPVVSRAFAFIPSRVFRSFRSVRAVFVGGDQGFRVPLAPLKISSQRHFSSCVGNDVADHVTSGAVASIHAQKNRAGNTYRVLWRRDGQRSLTFKNLPAAERFKTLLEDHGPDEAHRMIESRRDRSTRPDSH